MKQAYPAAMQPTEAVEKAAADARPISGDMLKKTGVVGELLQNAAEQPRVVPRELKEKRSATSSVHLNKDGTLTEKRYFAPKHYKEGGSWEIIDTSLIEDKNAGDAQSALGRAWGEVQSWYSEETTFKVKANDWQSRFAESDAKQGMLRIGKGQEQVSFSPVGAKSGIKPVVTKNEGGYQVVRYYDLWPGIDVEYLLESGAVKENVIIKNKDATNSVSFTISGATLEERVEDQKYGNFNVKTRAYVLKGLLDDEFSIAPANLILNNFGFVSDQSVFEQKFEGDKITLSVDKNYLRSLPDKAFPAVIDPSTFHGTFGTRDGGNYVSFKSDGFVCGSTVCNPYAGSLFDTNNILRYWRSAFYAPYGQLNDPSKALIKATLHLQQRSNESFWTGTTAPHTYYAGHATCLNHFWNCLNSNQFNVAGVIGTSGDIDVTGIYQSRIGLGDYGAWLMLGGEDGTIDSFKNFDPGTGPYNSGSYIAFEYSGPPAAPGIKSPVANQVFVDPQPSFSVAFATNPNGASLLQYQMRVSNGAGGTGQIMASPLLRSTQWTIPDNVLQDGSTYFIQARSFDPVTNFYSDWGSSVPFRIDMRTGSDATQTTDSFGPVGVSLSTGNLSTGTSTHNSTALGGSLGLSLNYNTPLKSRNGLVGEYWNVSSGHNSGVPSATPSLTRVDQNIDFNWDTGSPSSGTITNDWFYVRWSGHFVAPETGTYKFGGSNDDLMVVRVNNQLIYSNGGCYSGICYDSASISLQKGQVVPISVEHQEATGPAYARLFVKGAVTEKLVPSEWLQTGVRPINGKKQGLKGTYFARLDNTNTFSASNYKVMERIDPHPSFNWGAESFTAGGPNDFLVRWQGNITVPVSGTYSFGSRSDDGTKITVGTTTALNDWTSHGAPATPTWGSTNVALTANTPTPIVIEYYDEAGAASFELWSKNVGVGGTEQIVPGAWLSSQTPVLPDGWDIGVDSSGTARYNYLKPEQNGVTLMDSTGSAHEYTWTGSGYKPPLNENGNLVRNVDGTFTLQDGDGQTYVFDIDGKLLSTASPADDRNPAALQYEYQSPGGGSPRLYRVKDGVDLSRNLTVYYSGQSQCGSAPSGFDMNAPSGMICAVETNDGRVTKLHYVQGQLARIASPGNSNVDYQYAAVTNGGATIGYLMSAVRDTFANDAIAAGVRSNDDNVKTQIVYDVLGRVTSVTQPAPTTGAARLQQTIEYLPGAKAYVDENGSAVPGYAGMTKRHVTGMTEPKGFSRQIKYDGLYRTIESTNIEGLSITTQWHEAKDLVYSMTDATGLMSTTVYDDEDRAVSNYGPAPKAWFATGDLNSQVPLSAYAGQVPRTDAGYDEGISGPAVAWFDYTKLAGNTAGALTGTPKQHATGINANTGVLSNAFTSPPITASTSAQGIGFNASGKLRLPNGAYTVSADTSDGIRVWVDDRKVLDQWVDAGHRTVTGTSFTINDNAPKRIVIEAYRRTGSTGTLNIKLEQSGGFAATTDWSSYLKPGYNLATSSKSYDSTIGDTSVAIGYGANPELAQAKTTTIDQTGLNLSAAASYEQQGASGSFLRPESVSRPGDLTNNPAVKYEYYDATATRDNPCTTEVEAYKQAGMTKKVINASPDGGATPGRVSESRYDDAGRIVAARYNSEDWTCISYDSRGRTTETIVPAVGSEAARTITNNYAVYGDPTITSVEDSVGVNQTQVDLLGRVIYYHDAYWNETWTGYDSFGRMIWRSSDIGDEDFVYDNYNRLVQQKLDNTTYAVVTYDQYGRVQSTEYPNAGGQKMVVSRDALGRTSGQSYYAGGSQTPGGNLIANPSVEQSSGTPAAPEDWTTNSWGTNTTNFTYLSEGYSGGKSVKTEVSAYTDGDAKWSFEPVTVMPGTTYTYKDYYKSDVSTQAIVEYTHQDQSLSYEWIGNIAANSNWTQSNFNFTAPSTATKASVLRIVNSVGWLIVDDAELKATSSGSQTVIASDTVVRSQSGRIVSGNENGQTKSYTYDKAGRLTGATIGANTYAYGYGTQSGTCAVGTNGDSGKNFNRTSQTINGVASNFCYDYADRLVGSSDMLADDAQYDSRGNMTQIGSGTTPLHFSYDSSDRNWALEQYDSGGDGSAVYYSRDVQGRIIHREMNSITDWSWASTGGEWYGFVGGGDSPSFVRDENWDVKEKYLSLAGGVLLTIRPQETGDAGKVYSLPNLSGAIMATTDASGTLDGTYRYDPYGNKISSTLPDNTSEGVVLGWAGVMKRATETTLTLMPVQMGARVYLPGISRFAQVDPVPGGNANDYAYAVDPINTNDFSGRFLQGGAGAGFLQPAAGAGRVQPAAPAPYVQPAAGVRPFQNAQVANSGILRSPVPGPVKPRDTSTRLPAATVAAAPDVRGFLTKAASEWQSTHFVEGDGKFHGYMSASGGYTFSVSGIKLSGGMGVKFNPDGIKFFYYTGTSWNRGVDWSITMSDQPLPSAGCNYEGSLFVGGLGGSVDSTGNFELGAGSSGLAAVRSCVI